MDQEDITSQIKAACSLPLYHKQNLTVTAQGTPAQHPSLNNMSAQSNQMDCTEDAGSVEIEDILSNGTCKVGDGEDTKSDRLALSNDSMSEFSNNDLSLPEVCISSNSNSFEDDMNYEVQQAYRIFTGFLLDKHKGITNPFLHPIGHQEAQHGIGGVRSRGHAQLKQSMCLKRIEEKFINQEYETITEFVADFRLMLENCYRYHGVDHWISKQAQKLEVMLEQKLTLLSRKLREKTTLAVTSKGRFGAEEERASGGTSTRRRLAPRSLATMTVVGHESVMVQALRQEEQQRAKDEKRQRELEKKEAEEMSAKEVEEWEQSLLSQASPHTVDTLWELPAIGHFLCLAQTALNLPEIVFFELERCLLMPRCSPLLSKIMSSLLSPSQRRATLHRRPALPYRRWESELRQRVMGWYRVIGASSNQPNRAEQLGLCHQFFCILGQVSPLEEKPFHLLPFYQRVWLLKGLCDHVYETQKDVQDAVLSQPIHECRESILGYDSKENAYIHFPHFCGADLRIYCQSPSTPPAFPFPSVWVKMVDKGQGTEGEESSGNKDESTKSDRTCFGVSMDTGGSEDFESAKTQTLDIFKVGNWDVEEEKQRIKLWSLKQEEGTGSESGSSNGDSCDDSKLDLKIHNNPISFSHTSPTGGNAAQMNLKEEPSESEHQSKQFTIKQEQDFSLNSNRTIKAETQEPCLNVGEHSYTGRSPARLVSQSPTKMAVLKMEDGSLSQGRQSSSCLECCKSKNSHIKSEDNCNCNTLGLPAQLSSESVQNSSEERVNDKIWTKKKKRKKKRGREQLLRVKGEHRQLQHVDRMRLSPAKAAKSTERSVAPNVKKKDKKKKHKSGKKLESSKKCKEDPPVEPSFKLVCTSLEELRELINKTEDELDDLESTKKRLGRWYYRREAVKDLHSTLIRLLNELSPWEPKLVKAFQRNRLRLKKEFDDFRKHPEYNNFVREECISSSSSDDDEDKGLGNEMCSLSDHHRRSEEEDLEHVVPRGLWSEAANKEFEAESSREQKVTSLPPDHLHPLASVEKGISVLPRIHIGSNNPISTVESGSQLKSEMTSSAQSRDSNSVCAASVLTQASLSPRPSILHPTTGLPKGYTPIPTLLAKSVGNKVTLMKRPADYPGANNMERRRKGSLVCLPNSAVTTTKPSKAQISSSSSLQAQGLKQMEVVRQPGMAMVTAAIPKLPQAKPTQTVPKSPVQVVYKMPERVGHLVRTDSSPVKISVHPAVDQNTREKIMQQVVILPSNLLIHKTEENTSSSQQQQPKAIAAPVSKVASPICMSTNVPGFTIPENRIPVQQVAPLTDASTVRTPSPSVSPHLQQGAMSTTVFKGTQVSSPKGSTIEGLMPSPSHTETAKTTDPKQELKTVCIRDSQSILVTTRGGNTGIVKVQTSSEQNAPGSLTSSPVITISPQFKAFLVSKTSATLSPSAPSQASPCAAPAITTISLAQPLKQVSSVLMSPSTVTSPLLPAVTGSIPVAGLGNQTASTTACLSHSSNNAIGKTVAAKTGQLAHTAPSSHFQASLIKSAVPSLSSSGVSQVITQAEVITKAGVKRASSDDRSQVTKFILVTPSSSTTSNVALSKGTLSATKPIPSSRVMFISQPSGTSPTTTVGSIPKQVMAKRPAGLPLSTSLPNQALKTGLNPGQAAGRPTGVTSETFSSVRNITLPTGSQIQLLGKTTTIGQTIGALHSPSKSTPVSIIDAVRPPVNVTEVAPVTSSTTLTSCLAQLASCTSVTTTSPLKKSPSFTKTSQPGSLPSTSTAVSLSVGSLIKKEFVLPLNMLSNNSTAQVTTTVQSGPAQTSVPNLYCPSPSKIQSGIGEKTTPSLTACQVAFNKTQTPVSSPAKSNSQFSNSASGTIQQRIVINTSTPLAAGTQILLNNTRFVVPPQGLGPGSHVLIISSPTPVQVPTASATSKRASVPPQEASHVAVAPRAPVLPQLPARLPDVPTLSSPLVSCPTTVAPSLLATSPNVTSVRLTGTSSLGSTVLHSKSNVMSTLPRKLTTQAGNLASAPTDTPSLVSPSPSFSSMPALVSPVVTSAPTLGAALATVGLASGRPKQTECLSTTSSAVGPHLSTGSTATSSIGSVLPNPSVPITLSSGTAPVVAGFTPALRSSLPAQHVVPVTAPGLVIQPQQTAVGVAAPSTALSQILDTTSFKKTVPQPVLPGTRTQVLPTVAVPPIISAVARMQTLPIATVTPIGSTVNTFETAPVVTALSSSGTVKITAAQPITSPKTSNTICQSLVLTNQALEKHSLQTSSLGMHNNVASKLLISPDGAVLNTVQCQVKPAELTTCPKPRDALGVSPHGSSGALHPHDSSLQASPADRKCTN